MPAEARLFQWKERPESLHYGSVSPTLRLPMSYALVAVCRHFGQPHPEILPQPRAGAQSLVEFQPPINALCIDKLIPTALAHGARRVLVVALSGQISQGAYAGPANYAYQWYEQRYGAHEAIILPFTSKENT
jgi:hypothetical protein